MVSFLQRATRINYHGVRLPNGNEVLLISAIRDVETNASHALEISINLARCFNTTTIETQRIELLSISSLRHYLRDEHFYCNGSIKRVS